MSFACYRARRATADGHHRTRTRVRSARKRVDCAPTFSPHIFFSFAEKAAVQRTAAARLGRVQGPRLSLFLAMAGEYVDPLYEFDCPKYHDFTRNKPTAEELLDADAFFNNEHPEHEPPKVDSDDGLQDVSERDALREGHPRVPTKPRRSRRSAGRVNTSVDSVVDCSFNTAHSDHFAEDETSGPRPHGERSRGSLRQGRVAGHRRRRCATQAASTSSGAADALGRGPQPLQRASKTRKTRPCGGTKVGEDHLSTKRRRMDSEDDLDVLQLLNKHNRKIIEKPLRRHVRSGARRLGVSGTASVPLRGAVKRSKAGGPKPAVSKTKVPKANVSKVRVPKSKVLKTKGLNSKKTKVLKSKVLNSKTKGIKGKGVKPSCVHKTKGEACKVPEKHQEMAGGDENSKEPKKKLTRREMMLQWRAEKERAKAANLQKEKRKPRRAVKRLRSGTVVTTRPSGKRTVRQATKVPPQNREKDPEPDENVPEDPVLALLLARHNSKLEQQAKRSIR